MSEVCAKHWFSNRLAPLRPVVRLALGIGPDPGWGRAVVGVDWSLTGLVVEVGRTLPVRDVVSRPVSGLAVLQLQ